MRTQIIATIGPRSESKEKLEEFIIAGMNIARMNFSHCTYDEYTQRVSHIQSISKKHGKRVAILQDLQGPRIRVGEISPTGKILRDGETVLFSTKETSDESYIYIDDPYIHLDIKPNDPIFLANGEIELLAEEISGNIIRAKVIRGGILYSRKAVNVPNTTLTTSGLTKKDKEDVKFALDFGVDYIALSFVQLAKDVLDLKKMVGDKVKIIAKIESAVALKNIDEIIQASDGIMVARGDLGVEIPMGRIPFIQKNLIKHAIWRGKPAIVATQMLSSMINHQYPTRAEVSDIANAVWDGADAVMLSDETAAGKYPLESLKTIISVVREAEKSYFERSNLLV